MKFNLILRKIGSHLISLARKYETSERGDQIQKWFSDRGDQTLRLNYGLTNHSVVFDLGGYEGQWASDIYSKYRSTIYIFEPVLEFYDSIKARFESNPDIKVFRFGLSSKNSTEKLFLKKDGSSVHSKTNSESFELIDLIDASLFLSEQKIQAIDLMKINIEGGEYELLEYLLKSPWIAIIKNIQVQFHDFVEDAEPRMKRIQAELSKTHEVTYKYKFVWENWRLKD